MKIFFAVVVIVLLFVIGATLYVYKKSAMFLPALLGICGFPKIKESSYYDENGHFRPGTGEDKVGFFMQHPVFGGFKHMFFNVEDNVLKAIAPVKYKDFLKAPGREEQLDAALESFNYLTGLVEKGQARLVSDLYPAEAVKGHPYRSHLTGMFYQGQQGKPLAIVVPGQLGETEQVKQGQAAARELTQVIRYLTEHQKQFSVNMDDYAIFGFSAGGLMTTAYSFANYEDCCHKNHLPRPKVIFPMYGLDWNIKALQEDKGLAVFSIVGRDDEFGFANVEDKLPELEKVLGKENVSVRIVDGLGHGFGIGNETKVKNWLQEAVIFWEAHR